VSSESFVASTALRGIYTIWLWEMLLQIFW